jgi:hypothetical protein
MGADDEWRDDLPPEVPERDSSNPLDELPLFDLLARHNTVSDTLPTDAALIASSSSNDTHDTGDGGEILEPAAKKEKIGGFSFYLSLLALLPTGILTVVLTLYTWDAETVARTSFFFGCVVVGALLAKIVIRAHFSVLLHEFKHQIISNLVGNKAKGLHIEAGSGHFEYSYTKRTKHFHAFISLAPYILPLCTFTASLCAFALAKGDHMIAVGIVGIGYGADLLLNTRDISPIQTDINEIRGGYGVGLLYIAAWNLLIFGVLLAWVFHGIGGFALLLAEFSALFLYLHQWMVGGIDQEVASLCLGCPSFKKTSGKPLPRG